MNMNMMQSLGLISPSIRVAAITFIVDGVEKEMRFPPEGVGTAQTVLPIERKRKKPGPKSLPKAYMKSTELHQAVLDFLADGRRPDSHEVQAHIYSKYPKGSVTKNTVAFALVELQNRNCKRGKQPKSGPVVKLIDGTYTLRSLVRRGDEFFFQSAASFN